MHFLQISLKFQVIYVKPFSLVTGISYFLFSLEIFWVSSIWYWVMSVIQMNVMRVYLGERDWSGTGGPATPIPTPCVITKVFRHYGVGVGSEKRIKRRMICDGYFLWCYTRIQRKRSPITSYNFILAAICNSNSFRT